MAQRQFRSDDTSPWVYRYGDGSAGNLTVSASTTLGAGQNEYWNSITATSGTTTGALGSSWGPWVGPVLIHQTQGTNAGLWELNYINLTGATTTATFLLPLINSYTTGAQIVTAGMYQNITVNTSQTLTVPAWNGSSGGIAFLLASGTTTFSGALSSSGTGFRGANNPGSDHDGLQGEGYSSSSYNGTSQNANANGGGGGWDGSLHNVGFDFGGGGGGGGGNASAGSNGNAANSSALGGTGGSLAGNAGLTAMVLGGGAGSGAAKYSGSSGGTGGIGGGSIVIISRTITIGLAGALLTAGTGGGNGANGDTGGGGGGAGGNILLKGQIIHLNGSLSFGGGTAGSGSGSGASGGAGSTGRVHVDYALSSSSGGGVDVRQDAALADAGGSFLLNFT